jgi:hypothetical protein
MSMLIEKVSIAVEQESNGISSTTRMDHIALRSEWSSSEQLCTCGRGKGITKDL